MQIYTFSKTEHVKTSIFENLDSFIWTDRYSAFGDFTIKAPATKELLLNATPGTLVGFDESDDVKVIKTVLIEEDKSGHPVVTITGRSLTELFKYRISTASTTSKAPVRYSGTPGAIVTALVNAIVVPPTTLAKAAIPGLEAVNSVRKDTGTYTMDVKVGTLYDRVKEICDAFDLGFRIIKPALNTSRLVFQVHRGIVRANVVFGAANDSLTGVTHLKSENDHYTHVMVYNETTGYTTTAAGYGTATGFDYRVGYAEADELKGATASETNSLLLARGRQILGEHPKVELIDGEVNPRATIVYGRDYFMGDVVYLASDVSKNQEVRVTEHIWAFDSTGYKSYPTLSASGEM